jgi:hypothetical protein
MKSLVRLVAFLGLALTARAESARVSLVVELDGGAVAVIRQDGALSVGAAGAQELAYDAAGENVVRIGNLPVRYDSSGKHIVQVGELAVAYDDGMEKVTRIGALAVTYDSSGRKVTGVGEARVEYDPSGQNVTAVRGTAGRSISVLVTP